MNRKKVFYILVISLTILLIYILLQNLDLKDEESVELNYIGLTEKLNDYKEYSINILHTNKNHILGTIETDQINPIVFSTVAVFDYDISRDSINIISQSNNQRIIEFYIINEQAYYVYLYIQDNGLFEWKILTMNLTTGESHELLKGNIAYAFEYPRIFAEEDGKLYLVVKANDEVQILFIEDAKINIIKSLKNEKINSFDMNTITYQDEKIYYSCSDIDNKYTVKVLDIYNGDNKSIYKSTDERFAIYTFNVIEHKIIIQEIIDNGKSNLITVNINSNIIENTVATELLTLPEIINAESILFHQSNNTWKVYNIIQSEFYELDFMSLPLNLKSIFPKYFLIDNNKILIQDFNNTFYIIDIYL
ncbi:MAG: hypothetical protein HFJ24_03265 [Clostridia bacterium]|nr:hypothetical protein [Clostridia bacterium]MCI9275040.1 hypothetical protein [Clostridia bacterium]